MNRAAFVTALVLALAANIAHAQQEFDDEQEMETAPRPRIGQMLDQWRKNLLGLTGANNTNSANNSNNTNKKPTSGNNGFSAATKVGTGANMNSRPVSQNMTSEPKTGDVPKMAARPNSPKPMERQPSTAAAGLARRLFSPNEDDMEEEAAPVAAKREQPTSAKPKPAPAAAQPSARRTVPTPAPETARKPTTERNVPTMAGRAVPTMAERNTPTMAERNVPTMAERGTPTMAKPKPNVLETVDEEPPAKVAGTPTPAAAAAQSSRRVHSPADDNSSYDNSTHDKPSRTASVTPSVMPRMARSEKPLTPTIDDHRSSEPAASRFESSSNLRPDRGVLIARSSPNIGVETSGPRRIMVGKEAAYTVAIKNSGDVAAQDVNVFLAVPDWAEVIEARATTGAARNGSGTDGVQWTIGTLPGGGQHEMTLKIVPRKSQAFELGIRWTCSPVSTQTTVEVQEPKLQMDISGPTDVLFGQRQLYKLTITNPGTGDADGVAIHLMPVTPGDGVAASHRLGTLHAGDTKSVEIELTARQAGRLTIKAEATADGGLKTMAFEEIHVRRAALQVSVAAPKVHYAGAMAIFEIHVRNPGDAPAKNVTLAALLPNGAELVSAGQGGQSDVKRGEVTWSIDQLGPASEQVFTAECVMKHEGNNRLELTATADGELKDVSVATTQVMALADLVLEVVNAPGPVPVGQETTYEIRIRNRGTGAAEHVDVVAFFSDGIEPVSVEGGAAELSAGTATFKPLASLFPGRDTVLKVKAKADRSGNHRIRVELECKTLDTKLTQEHTKLFYGDTAAAPAPLRAVR